MTSVFLRVAETHFRTTLAAQNQPHTISLHLEFLRRTQEGPAVLVVRDVKLGRQTSTVHIALSQDSREEVVGYLTHSHMNIDNGLSLKTLWSLHPAPPLPPADFRSLLGGTEDHSWKEVNEPHAKFRKVTQRVRTFVPREGQVMPGLVDEWLRLDSGEKFTNESLGFASDSFPPVIEDLWYMEGRDERLPSFWYPTVILNLDIKKVLPPEGVEWLFVRIQPKNVRNGKMDLEVIIMNDIGEIIALSNHVVLLVGTDRNLAARRNGQNKI